MLQAMGDPDPGSGPRSYWEQPKPMNGCMKAFVILLVGLGLIILILLVFAALILIVTLRMDADPAFHGYAPAAPFSLVRLG